MDTMAAVKLISPALLFALTLGMGMTLGTNDIRQLFKSPRAVAVGLFCQMVLLPLTGLVLVTLVPVSPQVAVGVLLLTFCPGGAGSNISSLLARGDVALSISLTLLSGCLIVITLPLLTHWAMTFYLGEGLDQSLPLGDTIIRLIGLVLVPVMLGILVRHRWPAFAARMEPRVRIAGFILLSGMIAGVLVSEYETFLTYSAEAGTIVTLLCGTAMALGWLCARLFRLNRAQSTSIVIEVGIQNTLLVLVIAGLLDLAWLTIPATVYVVVSSALLLVVIAWANLSPGRPAPAPASSHARHSGS